MKYEAAIPKETEGVNMKFEAAVPAKVVAFSRVMGLGFSDENIKNFKVRLNRQKLKPSYKHGQLKHHQRR